MQKPWRRIDNGCKELASIVVLRGKFESQATFSLLGSKIKLLLIIVLSMSGTSPGQFKYREIHLVPKYPC